MKIFNSRFCCRFVFDSARELNKEWGDRCLGSTFDRKGCRMKSCLGVSVRNSKASLTPLKWQFEARLSIVNYRYYEDAFFRLIIFGFKQYFFDLLIDSNDMSNCVELFYVKKLGNRIYCTYYIFSVNIFSKYIALGYISIIPI